MRKSGKVKISSQAIRDEMAKRGLTGEAISTVALGKSKPYLSSQLMSGHMNFEDLERVCTLLQLSISDVVIEEDDAEPEPRKSTKPQIDHMELLRELQKFSAQMIVFTEKQKQMDEEIANLLTTIKSQCVIQTNMMKEIINKMQ